MSPIHRASSQARSSVLDSNRLTSSLLAKLAHANHIDCLITNRARGNEGLQEEPICPCGLYTNVRHNACSTTKQWNQVVKCDSQGN